MLGSVSLQGLLRYHWTLILFRLNHEGKGMTLEMPDGYFEWASLWKCCLTEPDTLWQMKYIFPIQQGSSESWHVFLGAPWNCLRLLAHDFSVVPENRRLVKPRFLWIWTGRNSELTTVRLKHKGEHTMLKKRQLYICKSKFPSGQNSFEMLISKWTYNPIIPWCYVPIQITVHNGQPSPVKDTEKLGDCVKRSDFCLGGRVEQGGHRVNWKIRCNTSRPHCFTSLPQSSIKQGVDEGTYR